MNKKPEIRFKGKIENGKFKLEDIEKNSFQNYCRNKKDGIYYITIKKEGRIRTLLQNSYYWVLMTILGNELGLSKDEAHDLCKNVFLRERKGFLKEGQGIPRSTATLTRWEFIQYIDAIRLWAANSFLDESDLDSLPFPIILPEPTRIAA